MKYIPSCCFRFRLPIILSLTFLILLGLVASRSMAGVTSIDEVRVGIFDNKPMCYFDDTEKPAGIFVSLIEYIAAKEGWKIDYIKDNFSSLRTKLEKGEIDLLLSTAVSEKRRELYTFNGIDVFNNWAEVYVSPESNIKVLLDLNEKRIATLRDGIYSTGHEGIDNLCDNIHLNCEIIFVDDYKSCLIAVKDGHADAGIVNRLVGAVYENNLGLKKSGIVFSPVHIRFALNKESSKTDLIVDALDQHLAILKQDNNSIYHHTINEALGGKHVEIVQILPEVIKHFLYASSALIGILFIFSFFLRRQVKSKTKDLSRINTELTQRKSEFEAIFNAITDAVVFVDQEQRVIMINPGFTKVFGYKPEELLGQTTQAVYANPEDFTEQGRIRYRPEAKITRSVYEIKYRRKDGSFFPAETLGAQVLDSRGEIIGFLKVIRDITERKQADEKLLRSEERYRRLTENASDMIYRMSLPDGKYEYVSPAAKTIFGYSPKEFYDTPILIKRTIHPAWVDYFAEQWKLLIAGDMPPTYEYQIINKSGEERWLNQRNVLVKNDSGQSIAIEGVVTDITESKQTGSALMQSEARLQSILSAVPIGIGVVIDRVLVEVNNRICEMIGRTKDELLGKSARILYPTQEEFEKVGREKYSQIKEHRIGTVETLWLSKDGLILNVLLSSSPIIPDDLSVGVTFTATDITKRKQAEIEKAKLEEQLHQAYKMEAIGTLAGGIAHDFNNILSIILGNAELIKSDSADTSLIQDGIAQIQMATDRAKHLVQQILAFSRQMEHDLIPMKLQHIVKETLKLLRATIPTTIEIKQDIHPQCVVVNADPAQINQIVMNLCANAVHGMDEKGVLSVTLKERDFKAEALTHKPGLSPGTYVCLSVSDTGKGMDQETIDHIFEPFYTTKEIGKGTGMGLSVVHGIVESHGGFITVESELGRGTTFNVCFPVTGVEEFLEVETKTPSPKGTESILIVDDETMILDLAERMLVNLGYKVTAESSSVKALEIFKSKPDQFDLIITDQTMPDMSGTEFVAEILQVKSGMPVILATGYSSKISEEEAGSKGISIFVNKPYSIKLLAEAIREVLDKEA